jgi:hypothetical protein
MKELGMINKYKLLMHKSAMIVLGFILLTSGASCSSSSQSSMEAIPNIKSISTSFPFLAPEEEVTKTSTVTPSVTSETKPTYGDVQLKEGVSLAQLHREPSIDSEIVAELQAGQVASVIGKNAESDWLQIVVDRTPAWVFSSLVEFSGNWSKIPTVAGQFSQDADQAGFSSDEAIASIKDFTLTPDLLLTFQSIDPLPNANLREAARFIDDQGTEYWVDILSYQVVEFDVLSIPQVDQAKMMGLDELKAMAEKFAQLNSARFVSDRLHLTYDEGTKGEIYFFRWEAVQNADQPMPPLLQIGMTVDGQIVSYVNTLDLEYASFPESTPTPNPDGDSSPQVLTPDPSGIR